MKVVCLLVEIVMMVLAPRANEVVLVVVKVVCLLVGNVLRMEID